jgi:hypothetical protein
MFAVIAAIVFATAFTLAIGTMAFMFATYRDKMIAALLYTPEIEPQPAYQLVVRHQRVRLPRVEVLAQAKSLVLQPALVR